jgi:hypothetical protein
MRNPLSRRNPAPAEADADPGEQPTEATDAVVEPNTVVLSADEIAAAAQQQPDAAPTPDAPAGTDPGEPPAARLSFAERSRVRRRLRYLRRVRELGFRDLGGLVFDLHRFGRHGDHLVRGKLNALAAVDGELRRLERTLGDEPDVVTLREAGIAACPRCGALHGSDANFCPSCGISLDGPRAVAEVAVGAPPGAVTATPPASGTSLFQDAEAVATPATGEAVPFPASGDAVPVPAAEPAAAPAAAGPDAPQPAAESPQRP